MQVGGRQLGLPGQDRAGPDQPGSRAWRADQRQSPGAVRRSGHRERVAREHRPARPLGGVFPPVRVGAAAARGMVSGAVCAGSNPAGGAVQSLFFESILVNLFSVGQLRPDSVNRPSTRRFMTRCHSTRPSNRLPASLLARDLRERFPSQKGSRRAAQLVGLLERAVTR